MDGANAGSPIGKELPGCVDDLFTGWHRVGLHQERLLAETLASAGLGWA